MNRTTALAAIVLSFAAAGSALADDITVDHGISVSTKSRADVAQELAQFKRGRNPWSIGYNVFAASPSLRTRSEVLAELQAARSSGELAAMTAEDSGSAYLAQARQKAVLPQILAAR